MPNILPINEILQGDVLVVLKTLPDCSVDCVITSPPYWGLRDYGTAKWEGGDSECDHIDDVAAAERKRNRKGLAINANNGDGGSRDLSVQNGIDRAFQYKTNCPKCGAVRIDNQLGLEKTPEEYVAKMVEIFREVRRVLKKEGTCWLNLGDSYAMSSMRGKNSAFNGLIDQSKSGIVQCEKHIPTGLKPKDLIGIPWRVAFALQADGWWLRQDVIWSKNNPMPESCTDRCTKSHEYIFLLTKSARYWYDAEAIKEDSVDPESISGRRPRNESAINLEGGFPCGDRDHFHKTTGNVYIKRNRRSVWTIPTQSFSGAHFATFPEKLVEPCLLAGCPKEVCPKCGKSRERIVKKEYITLRKPSVEGNKWQERVENENGLSRSSGMTKYGVASIDSSTVGWSDCGCGAGFVSGIVLDPFMGSGTTALVAAKNERNFLGIELNPAYIQIAYNRIVKGLEKHLYGKPKRAKK